MRLNVGMNLVRQHDVVRLDVFEIRKQRVPGNRPGGNRPADRAVVGQDLDIVAQADVAGLGLGRGECSGLQGG